MNTDFPDHLFGFNGNRAKFEYEVKEGIEICKSKKILFCGIVRNVEDNIERNILIYNRTVQPFKKSKLFLYENDSNDRTIEILEKYRSEDIEFVSEKRNDADYVEKVGKEEDPYHYNRCKALSNCRNKYLQKIQKEKWNEQYDYICIVDMDINGGWSYDGFYHSIYILENNNDAACISSYGVVADYTQKLDLNEVHYNDYVFYDTFAFRPINVDPKIHKNATFLFNAMKYNIGEEPEEVISNFNGLAIYKSKYFTEDKKYETNQWKEGYVDSEHIAFYKQIAKDGGKIYLNPSLVVAYSHHQFSRS